MKWLILSITALLFPSILVAFSTLKNSPSSTLIEFKKKNIISCSPDRNDLLKLLDDVDISPMPGAGKYHWKITTSSDSAQFYFDQGINMYYGFHIIEAMASFKKAAKFDPENPMVWWAQALALGPNINDVGYAASPEALATTQKAIDLSTKATAVEKSLILAMEKRYSKDSTQTREKLNQDYVDELKKAYQKYPNNADIAALYADALMLQHPWDLWNNDGTPKPWTPAIRTTLEKLLATTPQHPGANHYYIHVMEASPYAAKALPSADRLGKLTPGLSHLVHMPSHIYIRVGQFNKGTRVNKEAVSQFKKYGDLFPSVKENAFLYEWHNLHLQASCDMLAGSYGNAQKTALAIKTAIDTSLLSMPAPMGSYVQYMYATEILANVRFGKWQELINMTKPSSHHIYLSLLYHFGRGMGFAAQKNFSAAQEERKELQELMKHESLTIAIKPFSPPTEGSKCADNLLAGFIQLKQNKPEAAISYWQKAVEIEANMIYAEPRDWMLSPKQYLGTALLAADKSAEAQKIFEKDLKVNAENIWSLHGLQRALSKQNKKSEAGLIKARLLKASSRTDVTLQTSF
jgi:tetratricopeptide (TPR) repeat protein